MIFENVAFYIIDIGYSSTGEIVISAGISLIIYLIICVVTAKKMKVSFLGFIRGGKPVIEESSAKS